MRAWLLWPCVLFVGCAERALETTLPDGVADGGAPDLASPNRALPDLATPPPDLAPMAPWFKTSRGLGPGQINAIVADPVAAKTVYAATYGAGVFKSTDSGASWRPASVGLGNPDVLTIAIDPRNSNRLLAGTLKGVFRSDDAGATWWALYYGGSGGSVALIEFDPARPQVVYIVDGGALFRSLDGGQDWTDLGGIGSAGALAQSLSIDPGDPQHLLAVAGYQLWASHDGAASWQLLIGQPANAVDGVIGVTFEPSQHLLCAATGRGASVSTDDGASWTHTLDSYLVATPFQSPSLFPGPALYVAAGGVYRSTDCVHWTRVYGGTDAMGTVARDSSGAVFAPLQPGQGIIRSADGRSGWSLANDGLDDAALYSMTIDPAFPDHLYLATYSQTEYGELQLYSSSDAAASWQPALLSAPVYQVAASGDAVIALASPQLFRSFDRGGSWIGVTLQVGIVALAFDPSDPTGQRLYAAGSNVGIAGATQAGVFASSDQGASWSALPAAKFQGALIAADPTHAGRLWAVAAGANGTSDQTLYRSDDAGVSFSAVALPLGGWFGALAIAPGDGQTLFATLNPLRSNLSAGIVASVDGGKSWSRVGQTIAAAQFQSIAISPSDPRVVYVGTSTDDDKAEVWKSNDRGQSWRRASNGLYGGSGAVALLIDPIQPSTLYFATGSNGVFKTVSGGE